MEEQRAGASVDYSLEMDRHGRASIFTLVLGIAALVLAFIPTLLPFSLLASAAALITGLLMRRYTQRINIPEDRKNAIGRWCGLVGLLLSLVTLVMLIIAAVGANAA